jgi:hypothetical protein
LRRATPARRGYSAAEQTTLFTASSVGSAAVKGLRRVARGRLVAGAVLLVLFAVGAIALGRWERSRAIDASRSGIAHARNEAGPDLVSRPLISVVPETGLVCTQYRLQPSLGISLCWSGSGQLVEAVRFDGNRTESWSLADHPSAATIRAPVRFLAALGRYVAIKPSALAVAAAIRDKVKPCLRLTKQVLRRSAEGRLILAATLRVRDRCSSAQAYISAVTKQAPAAKAWLGKLPRRFRRLTAAVVYAANRLSFGLQEPGAIPERKRSAVAVYRERRKSAIARGVVLRAALKQAIARQVENMRALER